MYNLICISHYVYLLYLYFYNDKLVLSCNNEDGAPGRAVRR